MNVIITRSEPVVAYSGQKVIDGTVTDIIEEDKKIVTTSTIQFSGQKVEYS